MPTFSVFNNEPDIRSFSAGQVIFAEGQANDGLMYAVLEGEVEMVRHEQVLNIIGVGGLFGEMALLNQLPRTASAIVKADCRVAAISEQRLMRVISQNPHFALDMMRLLAERVRQNLNS